MKKIIYKSFLHPGKDKLQIWLLLKNLRGFYPLLGLIVSVGLISLSAFAEIYDKGSNSLIGENTRHFKRYIGTTLAPDNLFVDRFAQVPAEDPGNSSIPSDLTTLSRLKDVDTDTYTGYENAIYAVDKNILFIAYKRFLRNPIIPGDDYVPAELRVAKSIDGGKTWDIHIIDPNAIEQGNLIDRSVSIDGDHDQTIYVAYLVQSSGVPAATHLKVAKSTDGGITWAIRTIADAAGQFNSIRVVSASTALISTSREGLNAGVYVYQTFDGGENWSERLVDNKGWWYTSIDSAGPKRTYVSYYNPSYPDEANLYAAKYLPMADKWRIKLVDGARDHNFTGLGSSIAVSRFGTVYVSYEDFHPQETRSIVKVAKSVDGGLSWSTTSIDQDVFIGVNTSINVLGASTLFASYWHQMNQPPKGEAKLARSIDGGITWTVFAVPEPRDVTPYLDSVAPTQHVQYVSYQTAEPATGENSILRIARILR